VNHKELVKRAVGWLKNNQRCTIVVNELSSSYVSEQPDAIGFKGGMSTLIECKSSRGDFHRDSKKNFRQEFEFGMGNTRYYMAPVRMIGIHELPPGWGLLEAYVLTSIIRRLEISTAVFVRYEGDNQSLNIDGAKDLATS